MVPLLELETPEAIFRNDMRGEGHFFIDCSCGGMDGSYSGFHYKNTADEATHRADHYDASEESDAKEHTFYIGELFFLMALEAQEEEMGDKPLVVVCNDCQREFPFTLDSYEELNERMRAEYSRRVFEKDHPSGQSK